jgi:hypothetical protein
VFERVYFYVHMFSLEVKRTFENAFKRIILLLKTATNQPKRVVVDAFYPYKTLLLSVLTRFNGVVFFPSSQHQLFYICGVEYVKQLTLRRRREKYHV